MTAQDTWETELRLRAARGQIALVCGTGVTAALTGAAPNSTWDSLIESGLDYIGSLSQDKSKQAVLFRAILASADATAFIAVGEWLSRQFKNETSGEYYDWLSKTVGALAVKNGKKDEFSCFQTQLPILTTNYDGLLEHISGRSHLTWTSKRKLDRYHDDTSGYIFHLHGYWDDPDSVILSGSDYEKLAAANATTRVMESLASTHSLLLIGYGSGLQDPNFAEFLTWFTKSYEATIRRVYVLCRNADMPDKVLQGKVAYLAYGEKYEELPKYLSSLIKPQSKEKQDPSTDPDPVDAEELTDVLDVLPSAVKDLVNSKLGLQGVDRPPHQDSMLTATSDALGKRGAALVTAVTGTGKTTVARASMNLAVASNHSAMMILPTKALVAQESREWEAWEQAWLQADKRIRVYPSSRDYPENDSPVSKGRFEIAVAIYEKLSAFLVSGQRTLGNTALLVVDEMQTLVEDKTRAAKLEGLLTMVKLMPSDIRPAILGLSATMSDQSTVLLRRWLGVDHFHFIQSTDRPIPLDTYVVDPTRWRVQKNAHLLALSKDDPRMPAPTTEKHSLNELVERLKLGAVHVSSLGTAPLAVSLVVKLLSEDPSRRILVFVPGRTAAQRLAEVIQKALDEVLGAPRRRGSPWSVGRFADVSMQQEEAESRGHALANCDFPLRGDVIRGLRTGIAYHSARLAPKLRRDLEDEFRDRSGLLRVLVATDTLAMGVNLPADAVVATSLSGYGSDRKLRLATPAALDNKAGRAGRRGVGLRDVGEFYLLVPRAKDLQGVSGMTAGGMDRLATIDGVYDQFVVGGNRTPKVTGQIRDLDDVALLALQILAADGFGRSPAALVARVENVLSSLLAAQEPESVLPTAIEVITRLQALELIAGPEEVKIRATRLGEALARAGLQLSSSHVLERVARLATEGAGDVDLLFNACRSEEIAGVTAWVGLPSVHPRHYPSLKEAIVAYAHAYCHVSPERRGYCAVLFSKYPQPRQFIEEGQAVKSAALKELLELDGEAIDDRAANALLRALVAFEWGRGIPFDEIKARMSAAFRSAERERNRREVEIRLHYSDVEQLCEQIAGVIRGAADISFSESHDWSSRVRLLALQTEVGLPAWLAPVAKLRIDALHRNRLAVLWQTEPLDSGLATLLDVPQLANHEGISQAERERAREKLERREQEELVHQHRIVQEWTIELVPGMDGMNYEELGKELEECSTTAAYAHLMREVMEGIGAEVCVRQQDEDVLVTVTSEGIGIELVVPSGEIGRTEIERFAPNDALILLRSRLRPSALTALSSGPTIARFVQPEAVLSVIARLVSVRGEAVLAHEVVERLRFMRVSVLDSESVSMSLETGSAPPPFSGPMPPMGLVDNLSSAPEDLAD